MRVAPTHVRYTVLAALCLSAVISNVQRNCLGAAESTLRTELELTKNDTGLIMGAFFFTYALAQVPAGWLGGRWGTRLGLPIFLVLSSLSMAAFGLAIGLAMMLAARLLMGAAQAGTLPCCINTFSHWLPETRRGFASGSIGAALSIGGALGAALTAQLLGPLGWRSTFLLYALPGLVWSAWFWLWFRDSPADHPAVNREESELIQHNKEHLAANIRESTPWMAILSSPSTWWICSQQFCRGAGYIFFTSWFTTYLQEARGVSLVAAGWMTGLPFLGIVAGSPLGGGLSDWLLARTGSRRVGRQAVAVASQVICGTFILVARPIADADLAVFLITAGSFCSALGGPPAYAVTIDLGGRHVPVVFSIMNMAGNVGAALFPVVVPVLLGDSRQPNWDRVMFAFAGLHFAGAACWLCLNPNRSIVPLP